MFDIGWSEMAVIALLVIIVVGPKDLPHILRGMGRWMRKARAMAREFQNHVDDMVREAELEDLKKQVESAGRYDVAGEVERSIDPGGELRHAFDPEKDRGAGRGTERKAGDRRKTTEKTPEKTPETSEKAEAAGTGKPAALPAGKETGGDEAASDGERGEESSKAGSRAET